MFVSGLLTTVSWSSMEECDDVAAQKNIQDTYFLPMQFRGPMLNGSNAALLSDSNAGSNQRSGRKSLGRRKLEGS